jgi:hypothetical protein
MTSFLNFYTCYIYLNTKTTLFHVFLYEYCYAAAKFWQPSVGHFFFFIGVYVYIFDEIFMRNRKFFGLYFKIFGNIS